MKRFALALALACALSSTTLAGNIPTSDIASPPPPPGETQTPPGVTAPGDISTPGIASPGDIPGVPLSVLLTILDLAF